jgi:adenosylcobinamide-GDP ribazoletransferase
MTRDGGERVGEIRLFLTAVQYFTRIPVPAWVGHSPAQLNDAARWFPAVGALVGALSAAVYAGVSALATPHLGLVLALVASAWLTGAFHEDGLADTADALGGVVDRSRALEIMKDSRIGTYGALALVLAILARLGALDSIGDRVVGALIAGHALSRWLAVTVIASQTYVADPDLSRAKPLAHAISPGGMAVATICGLVPAALLGVDALVGLLAATAARLWLGRVFLRRLGGYTGDCLGATQQITEIAFYVGLASTPGIVAAWSRLVH